ncbi:GNAT family N-acetyltransferase [Photobacterium nomapromontoriensis]|uniref:GNAT family N-acetyltransferase n=1 Tax=Photobacterium nomapromontoriensis TaxID=2910237 RepID=UPI003D099E34
MTESVIKLPYCVPDDMQAQVIISIVMGFATDPTARWCWPDNDVYLQTMPNWVMATGGKAFGLGTAQYHNGCGALWLPPGVQSDEDQLDAIIQSTMTEQQQNTVALLGEKLSPFEPDVPHWYLPLIGAESSARGHGAGSTLITSVTQECDRNGRLAYLVCSNPFNVGFYQRQGFEVMGEVHAGDFPVMTPMLRYPRQGA